MDVDPADASTPLGVLAQDLADLQVAPGGFQAAEEQAIGMAMLATGDGLLQGLAAMACGEQHQPGTLTDASRPGSGQQQVVDGTVAGVIRQGTAEIEEVAVQVDVFMGRPAYPGKTIGVQSMQVQHREAWRLGTADPSLVAQQVDLDRRATKPLDSMAAAADHHQVARVAGAGTTDIDGQDFLITALEWMDVGLHWQATLLAGPEKLVPGLGVAVGEARKIHGKAS